MRGILSIIFTVILLQVNAQGINFQGVARSANGTILASSNISLRLSIISKNVDATPEYVETKTVVTNAQGIFSIVVGDASGTSVNGNFKNIVWSDGPKFLKVEMDPSGGTNFINMGATQLQYVPYSFYSFSVDASGVKGILPIEKGGTGVGSLVALKTALNIPASIDTTSLSNRINQKADNVQPGSSGNFMISNGTKWVSKQIDMQALNFMVDSTNMRFQQSSLSKLDRKNNTNASNDTSEIMNSNYARYNLALGDSSLFNIDSGSNNIAIGYKSLIKNKNGNSNTSVGGNGNLNSNTTGFQNNAFGSSTMNAMTTGNRNNSFGTLAMNSMTTGIANSAFGNASLRNAITGDENSSFGRMSMLNLKAGSFNSAFGNQALSADTIGSNNTAIGYRAGSGLRNGSKNVFLGNNAGANSAFAATSNKLVIENSDTSKPLIYGEFDINKVTINGDLNTNSISSNGIISSNKAIRPPSITFSQRNAITDTLSGMLIWCSNCGTSGQLQVFNGIEWTDLNGQSASGILKTYIPDNNFEQALITLGYDDVLDDSVITSNISKVKTLNIGWKGIQSLQGIQDFKYLEVLDVRTNKLSSLDVTRNLFLKQLYTDNTLIPAENYNTISSLDLSNNLNLQILSVLDNKLTSLDVTRNINLTELYINNNHSTSNNAISSIDISRNTKLLIFKAGMLPMSSINLTNNTLLQELSLTSMPITSVNLSNLNNLVTLNLGGTQLTSLDLSSKIKLETLYLLFNTNAYLSSLIVPANLKSLNIRSTALTSIDLSRCTGLKSLSVENTSLTSSSLNMSGLTLLENLNIRNQNNFGIVNYGAYSELKFLSLYAVNAVTSLNVSSLQKLNYLFLDNIPISTLDISQLATLQSFRATNIANLRCIKANQSQINARAANNLNWPIDNGTAFSLICN